MSWIHEIAPAQAEGELKGLYRELEQRRGKVAHILQVHSLRPAAMRAHLQLYQDLLFAPSGLSRRQREMIAVVVSRENGCDYCVAHHREALSHYVADVSWLDRLANGDEWPDLSDADRLLLNYAIRLTRTPDAISEDDIAALRSAGIGDADILLANLITAYFNFVNRIALGLGVSFDAEEVRGYAT